MYVVYQLAETGLPMNEIALFTTDELVDELRHRHPDGVIVAYQLPKHEVKDQNIDWVCRSKGDVSVLNKLANIALHDAYDLTRPEDIEENQDNDNEETESY